ncbi:MAG: uncharacterized protein PWP15_1397 [Methanothermococcus sp.]|uniref:DUF530 family protein n=1 Tax=Methanothermococcus sp. TaxID=2614238 RepID=UPI0025868231|nr:DUF530 family protein [Methanothermococcus sp.]MDK2790888.1 uncharacterized protein [Methanothermococcus sp.]
MESSTLIKKCNEFLDRLSKFKDELIMLDGSVNNDLIAKLEDNLQTLECFKEKMELKGFDTPFIGVGRLKGSDEDDIYDIMNYTTYLRRIVDEKKGALERVRYAIVAHKIALGNILDEIGNKEIIYLLPYDGSYKESLTNLPSFFIKTYKKILNIFESEGKGVISSTTLSLIVVENGKRKFKRVKTEEQDYERYIRENYEDAIITSIKRNYSKNKLLNDQYVKKILALAYLVTYREEIEIEIEKKLRKVFSKSQRKLISKYKEIMESLGGEHFEGGIIDVRVLDELKLKELKAREELEKLGLYKNGKPIEELRISLDVEKNITEDICLKISLKYLSLDLFNYYLHKTPDERTRSNMFPSILVTPSKAHLKWMNIEGIDAKNVLDLKFLFEKELPKYNIPLKNIGGVALYLIHDWDAVERFGFKKEDIEEVLRNMAPIENVKSILKEKVDIKKLESYNEIKKEKTKKFLNLLGKI